MHPVAKRCLIWAIVLVVAGTLLAVYGSNLLIWWQERVGAGAEPAQHGFGIIMSLIRGFALPLAAGLVTATIVIQTLAAPITTADEQ